MSRKILLSSSILLVFLVSAFATDASYASISASSIHVVTTIPVGDASTYSVYNPSNKYDYVINANINYNYPKNATVSIINTATNEVLATVKIAMGTYCCVGSQQQIIYVPSSKEVYILNDGSDSISILKGTSRVSTLTLAITAYAMTYDPSDKDVYVTTQNGVTLIDPATNTITGSISAKNVPGPYEGIVYNPSNTEMYVGAWTSSTSFNTAIVILKGSQVLAVTNLATNNVAGALIYDNANKRVVIDYSYRPNNNLLSTGIMYIDSSTNKIFAKVQVGSASSYIMALAFDPANSGVYVSIFANPNFMASEKLSMVSSTGKVTVVAKIDPSEMSYNPSNKDLYVPSGIYLYVLSPTNTISKLTIGNTTSPYPVGLSYSPSNTETYIVGNSGCSQCSPNGYVWAVSS